MRNGNLLKSSVSEICVKWIRINQGVGYFVLKTKFTHVTTLWKSAQNARSVKKIRTLFQKEIKLIVYILKRQGLTWTFQTKNLFPCSCYIHAAKYYKENLGKPVEVYFNWKVLKWKKFCWNLLLDSPQIVKWGGCIKWTKTGKNNTKTLIQSNRYKVPSIDSLFRGQNFKTVKQPCSLNR